MEKEFYHNDFEDFIKEKADQYKMYPSDKAWKNINSSLRSRRKWYWAAFVVLLSGTSYVSVTELLKPASARTPGRIQSPPPAANTVTAEALIAFPSSTINRET